MERSREEEEEDVQSLLCIETYGPTNFRPEMTRDAVTSASFYLPRW